MGWQNARHGGRAAGDGARIFPPHGRCGVGVVAWLVWGVVAGLLGVVWGGPGTVLGPFGDVLEEPFWLILLNFMPN